MYGKTPCSQVTPKQVGTHTNSNLVLSDPKCRRNLLPRRSLRVPPTWLLATRPSSHYQPRTIRTIIFISPPPPRCLSVGPLADRRARVEAVKLPIAKPSYYYPTCIHTPMDSLRHFRRRIHAGESNLREPGRRSRKCSHARRSGEARDFCASVDRCARGVVRVPRCFLLAASSACSRNVIVCASCACESQKWSRIELCGGHGFHYH